MTDFLAKLMILGQRYAIQANIETLNEQVFRHIADTKLKLLKPAIAALRSGDTAAYNAPRSLTLPSISDWAKPPTPISNFAHSTIGYSSCCISTGQPCIR